MTDSDQQKIIKRRTKTGVVAIILVFLAAAIGLLIYGPIAQSAEYHLFVDTQSNWGIANFNNVISNVPFVFVGILGIIKLLQGKLCIDQSNQICYLTFFIGAVMVGIGSAYYHLAPDSLRLVWDRLPMTIAFMALLSIVFSEFISPRLGLNSLLPLLWVGIFSIGYWYWTELRSVGDLRLYGLVQFMPLMITPLALLFLPSKFTLKRGYWLLFICYVAAKFTEHYDAAIFDTLLLISGHSLKHILAALGLYFLLESFERRALAYPRSSIE